MTLDRLFVICQWWALAGWLLLAFLPRWRWTERLVFSAAIPLALAAVYLVLVAFYFGRAEGNFSTLDGVVLLFSNKPVVLAGWIHYLVFDLFIGAWETRDAQRQGISHLVVVPCLFFTLMLGPVGLLCYFAVRWSLRREFFI
jgi:hypothetical protein